MNIDKEWEKFISTDYDDETSDEEELNEILKDNTEQFVIGFYK